MYVPGREPEIACGFGHVMGGEKCIFPQVHNCAARRASALPVSLEQIAFCCNRFGIPTERADLLDLFDVERIHTIGSNRMTVLSNRDPL
jgi:hypothetical protein